MESTSTTQRAVKKEGGFLYSFIKHRVINYLNKIEFGTVVVKDGDEIFRYSGQVDDKKLAIIKVIDQEFYNCVLLRGSVGAAEAFMKGYWTTPDLLQVVQVFSANLNLLGSLKMSKFLPIGAIEKMLHRSNENSISGSKENISKHYDLGNDFFKLFLDDTMMYSSGVFHSPSDSLFQASVQKLDAICQKLELSESDHVLEIGTGWGGFAVHAVQNYGCKVTTTTISRKQYDYTKALIEALNLEDSITLLLKDYRDLDGQYDKLVSIEMIEAVGHEYYESYFSQCNRLLKSGGLLMLQAITIPGQRYKQAKHSVDFIQKYIFPGGCLPSIEVISENISKYTQMQMVYLNDISIDYAATLKGWRDAFNQKVNQVKALGFDDEFIRMWNYYLCYCEGGFRERIINTHHILMHKSG